MMDFSGNPKWLALCVCGLLLFAAGLPAQNNLAPVITKPLFA
jgi:hypothetical protein